MLLSLNYFFSLFLWMEPEQTSALGSVLAPRKRTPAMTGTSFAILVLLKCLLSK